MDQPNGVCWGVTRESMILSNNFIFQEILYKHDPTEDINTEVDFYEY